MSSYYLFPLFSFFKYFFLLLYLNVQTLKTYLFIYMKFKLVLQNVYNILYNIL